MTAHFPTLAIASVCIYACRDTLAAGMATRFAGAHPDPEGAAELKRASDIAAGMSIKAWTAPPAIAMPIHHDSLDAIHDRAVSAAWTSGAWDIAVNLLPPLDAYDIRILTANRDWSDAPQTLSALVAAGERGRLAHWLWKPMHQGPQVRVKRHAPKDATLRTDHSRAGEPPAGLTRPNWAWNAYRDWTIRLGQWAAEHAPKPRPRRATPAQHGYLAVLLRKAGQRAETPRHLTFAEASTWIDELKQAGS